MRYALLIVTGLVWVTSNGQAFPDYGTPISTDLNLKITPLDPDADAVVLVREAIADYNDAYNLVTHHHLRLKILKEKGLSYADVSIPYRSNNDFESVSEIEAMVINVGDDGSLKREMLDRKSIYHRKLDGQRSIATFSFPSVKVGSILEYRYKSTMKSYAGLDDWTFQQELPVLKSRFSVTVIPNLQFSYLVYKSPTLKIDIKNDATSGKVEFEMKDVPPLTDEPYMDARRDYLQRVVFQLSGFQINGSKQKHMTSWNEVIRELASDQNYCTQVNKNLPGTESIIKEAKAIESHEERMRTIYEYVRSNMNWNHYYGVYTGGVKEAWAKKSGSISDINFILLSLLNSAGLQAFPMLVADRSYGRVNTEYPFIDQFSKTIAIINIENKKYYLDATEKFLPLNIVPASLLNTYGLVVNRKFGGIQQITEEIFGYKETVVVNVKLRDDQVVGRGFIRSTEYAKAEKRESYNQGEEKFLNRYILNSVPGISIDSFELQNDQNDSLPLKQNFTFTLPVNQSGEYAYFGLNYFTGFSSNPFFANDRFSSINFGYKRTLIANIFLDIPAGYRIDALPKSTLVSNQSKDLVFTREIFPDEKTGKLFAKVRIECKNSYYGVERYEEVKQFYKKMFDLLNEQVVLKKI